MKVVILAGGLPSMLYDQYEQIPKPMAEIGGRPILWHIMKHYASYGHNEFIICTGYKGDMIRDYFKNYYIYESDITIDLMTNHIEIHKMKTEEWKVTLVDTGLESSIPDRIIKIKDYVENESFIVSYGDFVSSVDIAELTEQHKHHNKAVTMVLAHPAGRNQALPVDSNGRLLDSVAHRGTSWVDASIMVFRNDIFEYLDANVELLKEPMFREMMKKQEIHTYFHYGFWMPMETKRDQAALERMWNNNSAPWRTW